VKYEVEQYFEIWHKDETDTAIVIGESDDCPGMMKIELASWENGRRKTEQIIVLDIEQVEIAMQCMQQWLHGKKVQSENI